MTLWSCRAMICRYKTSASSKRLSISSRSASCKAMLADLGFACMAARSRRSMRAFSRAKVSLRPLSFAPELGVENWTWRSRATLIPPIVSAGTRSQARSVNSSASVQRFCRAKALINIITMSAGAPGERAWASSKAKAFWLSPRASRSWALSSTDPKVPGAALRNIAAGLSDDQA